MKAVLEPKADAHYHEKLYNLFYHTYMLSLDLACTVIPEYLMHVLLIAYADAVDALLIVLQRP